MVLWDKILATYRRASKQYAETSEFKNFKKTLRRNPGDHDLRARFTKYCLHHHSVSQDGPHGAEAAAQFEILNQTDVFDPEIYYLMGKFFQGADKRKARQVYHAGITRFNRYIEKNPGLRNDFMEITLAVALNLLTLQAGPFDQELERFFKCIRKSYPIHVKRVELESEIEKPDPDSEIVRQLKQEILKLKADRDLERAKNRQKN